MKYYVGIDLGGTNIKAGIVSEQGEIVCKKSVKTNLESDVRVVRDMAAIAKAVIAESGIAPAEVCSVGIGAPGTPDNVKGYMEYANNLPFLKTPVRDIMKESLTYPIYIDNDANCAAMAESEAGAAKGILNSVTITIGTGLGCGVIINGRIYSGFNQAGSEFGHVSIVRDGYPCTCGRRGCFEAYASATGLIRLTLDMAKAHPESILGKRIAANGGKASGRHAFEAMREGDSFAAAVVDDYIEYLSEGLANIINAFMPEVLVVGGGVCNEGDPLMIPLIEKTMSKPYFGPGVKRTEIRIAKMGNDAGIVGAAMMGKACFDDGFVG